MGKKIVASNRKARFNYTILETYETGIVLTGGEVKSARDGKVELKDGYVKIENGEAFLHNVNIASYKFSAGFEKDYSPEKPRKLLLHKREITKLQNKTSERGFSLVPLEVYFKDGRLKVEIGVAKGKKIYDKRESIKKREVEREIRRLKG